MAGNFNYAQALRNAKSGQPAQKAAAPSAPSVGRDPVPVQQPAQAKPAPARQPVKVQNVALPPDMDAVRPQPVQEKKREPVVVQSPGTRAVPPLSAPTVEDRSFQFGGSSSGSGSSGPVDAPPERQQPVQRLKPKSQSMSGTSGMEGYFDDDGDDGYDGGSVLGHAGDASLDQSGSYMDSNDRDDEAMARMDRDHMKEELRGEIMRELEPQLKPQKKSGKGGRPNRAYRARGVSKADVKMTRMGVPLSLVERARAAFPDASKQEDAVAAYIFFREGMPDDIEVPDEIREIASKYKGEVLSLESVKDMVEKDILDLQSQNRSLAAMLDTVQLAMAYMIFEASGFRKADPPSPGEVDFLQHGMTDLLKRMKEQAGIHRERERVRNGRPIR